MACDICKSWYATSEKQLANRLANRAGTPGAEPFQCPRCGGNDWATSREMIAGPDERPSWRDRVVLWFRGAPTSWRALGILNAMVCACSIGLMLMSDTKWIAVMNAAIAGFTGQGVIHAYRMRIMMESFDNIRDNFSAMARLNDQLMQAKVEAVIFRADDGTVIAPETRH